MENKKQEELQQKLYIYQLLEQQQQMYTEKLVTLEQEIAEMMVTEESIRQLEEGDEFMLSLGKDCFVKASIKDRSRVIVDLGAGILASKKVKDAFKILEERRKGLEKDSDQFSKRLEMVSQHIAKIEPELQKVLGQR